jgi:hypothetical protein
MKISGDFRVYPLRASPVDVEFVLVHWDSSAKKHNEIVSVIASNRPSSKNPFDKKLRVDVKDVVVEPGDQIIYTFRSRELHGSPSFLHIYDNITYSIDSFDGGKNETGESK